jgi:hypothetical protein
MDEFHNMNNRRAWGGCMNIRKLGLFLLAFGVSLTVAHAQGYSGDARKIAMGGIGYSDSVTAKMGGDVNSYRSIVVPLGIIQLIQDIDRFDPNDDRFDPILLVEYAVNPLNFMFERESEGPRGRFITDAVNGTMSRDLNDYRGFLPENRIQAEGLIDPSWGYTFKFYKQKNGSFQGFYVGAGPYISLKTDLNFDKNLIEILNSTTPLYLANGSFLVSDQTQSQLALAITGGYRGRIAFSGKGSEGSSSRNGLYYEANYHYLYGFRHDSFSINSQFDTDSEGLLTINPETSPVVLDHYSSRSGRGFAVDFGVGIIFNQWEFGFAANGVANRINWDGLSHKQYRLESLLNGGDFVEELIPVASSDLKIELPVEYIGNAGYHYKKWSFAAEVFNSFQDSGFRAGAEYRLGPIDLRGGGRYVRDRWHPSGGIGLNFGKKFAIDVAAFGSTANIERQLKPGMAVSLRFNRTEK